jgi:hypothetical protein
MEAHEVDAPISAPLITPEELSIATAELSAAAVAYDFALTPARLPKSMYKAMKATWNTFRQGVAAFIDMHGGDIHRMAAALSVPAHLISGWDSLPPHDWAMRARPDMIIARKVPLIVDVNASSVAGHFAINDMLLRAHRTPELRRFFSGAGEPRFVMGHYADVLRRFLTDENDLIAISYFAEEDAHGPNPGRFHYQTEINELARLGLHAQTVHVEDLEVTPDSVYYHAQPVGLIHRHFIPRHDDAVHVSEVARIAAAARTGLVVIWTGLQGDIFDSKTTISTLSDERFTVGLRPSLAASLSRSVPWTRSVEERHTFWRGAKIDLSTWIARNREQLVLKPAIGGMGRAVMIGRETPPSAWDAQLAAALAGSEPWVVQELLLADSCELRLVDRAGATLIEQGPAVYGAFVLDGEFLGAICRHGRQGYSHLMINGLTGAIPAPVYWSGT